MNKALAIIGGLGLGAGLMYLYDPERGKKRREALAERIARLNAVSMDQTAEEARDWLTRVRCSVLVWIRGAGSGAGRKDDEPREEKVVRLHAHERNDYALPVDNPTARVLTGAVGAGLTLFGLRLGSKTGASLAALGLSLLASGLAGRDLMQ